MGFKINNGVLEKYTEEPGITEAVIPEGVTSIGEEAFSWCVSLTRITIPEGVTSIGKSAFYSCSNLTSITLPETLATIGESAFEVCSSLTIINIPDGAAIISDKVFSGCESLTSINLPEGLTSIGESAFLYCKKLTSIIFPESITDIGAYAFSDCRSLTRITIPNSVTSIGEYVFSWCENLTSITLPEGLTSIRVGAFLRCKKLTSIIIPEGVVSIGDKAFGDCKSLTNITIPDGVTSIGEYAFSWCESLTSITLPVGLTSIGDGLFERCSKLTNIIIPESVTSIGDRAFEGCEKLTSIILPEGLTSIGEDALDGCSNLEEINNLFALIRSGCEINPTVLVWLIQNPWKEAKYVGKVAEIFLTQKTKSVIEACEARLFEDCSLSVDAMLGLIESFKGNAPVLKKMTTFAQYCGNQLPREKSLALYDNLQKVGAKSIAKLLEKTLNNEGHTIEAICQKQFRETTIDLDLKAYGVSHKLFTGVRYQGTETLAPEFVVKCAIYPYMFKFKEFPKYYGCKVEKDSQADAIAETLDREDLQQLLAQLVERYKDPFKWRLLIPYCRYGNGSQMKKISADFKSWQILRSETVSDRKFLFQEAIMLNDTREAMLIIDKWGFLDTYAKRKNTTADILRDTVLTEFDLDADGSKRYDLGNAMIVATLREDLTVHLFNETTGKNVRLLPTKGADPEKLSIASEDLADLKKNIKNAVKSKVNKLKEDFVSASESRASDWKTSYTQNYVLKRIASLLVWQWNLNTTTSRFMLLMDGSFIDCSGQPVEVNDEVTICLAHPVELPIEELECWRELLAQKQIAQPFVQIFEPVIDMDPAVVSEHYEGVELPLYLLKGLSREGVKLEYGREDEYVYLELIGHAVRAGVDYDDRHSLYVAPSLAYDHIVKLRNVRIIGTRRAINHEIYAMYKVLISNRVRNGDIAAVQAVSHVITAKTIEHLIDVSIKAQQLEVTAWLMNYKNDHFPYTFADLEL